MGSIRVYKTCSSRKLLHQDTRGRDYLPCSNNGDDKNDGLCEKKLCFVVVAVVAVAVVVVVDADGRDVAKVYKERTRNNFHQQFNKVCPANNNSNNRITFTLSFNRL